MTRRLGILALLLGVALLAVLAYHADLTATLDHLVRLGWWGLGAIALVSLAALVLETVSWFLTLATIPSTPAWWARVGRVLLVGQALELVTPAGPVTGDSVKAVLLWRRYGVPLTDATASLVLSRTTDLLSLLVFVTIGLALTLGGGHLSPPGRAAAVAGLLGLVAVGLVFVGVQWRRPAGRVNRWLERRPSGRLPQMVVTVLDAVGEVEHRLIAFYRGHPARLALSAAASFGEWLTGAYITYLALGSFGTPVTFAEAVVIESAVLLVRSAFFFVPADLGTQEGALVVTCAAISGSASAGLALAAVRRARDLLVIAAGVALGVSAWRDRHRVLTPPGDVRAARGSIAHRLTGRLAPSRCNAGRPRRS